jgi:uncharacterized membrane protein
MSFLSVFGHYTQSIYGAIIMKLNRSQLKCHARQVLDGHYKIPVYSFLVTLLIVALLTMLFSLPAESAAMIQYVIYYVANFIISVLVSLLGCGLLKIHLSLTYGEEARFGDLLFAFRNRSERFLGAVIILLVLNYICLIPAAAYRYYITAAGETTQREVLFFVLLAAGIFVEFLISLNLALVLPLLVDNAQLTVGAAFGRSCRLMIGYKWQYFVLCVSFIGWILLGILSLFVGFLWISPYMTQTFLSFYEARKVDA